MDGVLADFDKRAIELLHIPPEKYEFKYGAEKLWERLNSVPDFFTSLDPMSDALVLWNAVKHLEPSILTALPKTGADRVAHQKREWVRMWLGTDVNVHTCFTREKVQLSEPSAILVDDRNINERGWTDRGGIFIHHHTAFETLDVLRYLGLT